MEHSQKERGLHNHSEGTTAERDEREKEESVAMEYSQPARNLVDQVIGEVNAMFGGGNSWVNNSAPPSVPITLDIYGSAASKTM